MSWLTVLIHGLELIKSSSYSHGYSLGVSTRCKNFQARSQLIVNFLMKIKESTPRKHIAVSAAVFWSSSFKFLFLCTFQDIEPEWQTAASKVLVALGSKASDEVMAELLQKLVPGTLPHYFVVLTLANLATENGKFMFFDFLFT